MKRLTCLLAAICALAVTMHAGAAGQYAGIDLYVVPDHGYLSISQPASAPIAAGGQVVASVYSVSDSQGHPTLFTPGGSTDLYPTFPNNGGSMWGTDGTQQVGEVGLPIFGAHATVWHGTAASAVLLEPTRNSTALGVGGGQQVGVLYLQFNDHAVLWNGTAASAVDLHPAFLTAPAQSYALGTNGSKQVGYGSGYGSDGIQVSDALLWSGSAASAIDLNPPGFLDSRAKRISPNGSQQVGSGAPSSGVIDALLWTGSAASAVDLGPGQAIATDGIHQIGDGSGIGGAGPHALLWTGTAASKLDLHPLLPFAATESYATSIDSQGNIFGIAYDSAGAIHAVEWTQVPEPAFVMAVAVPALALIRRRRR